MAQHLALQIVNEAGEAVATSEINFAEILNRVLDLSNAPFLSQIDPYGDTYFNHIQTKALIQELNSLQLAPPLVEEVVAFASQVKPGQQIKLLGD